MNRPNLSTSPKAVQDYVDHLEGLLCADPNLEEIRHWLSSGQAREDRRSSGLSQAQVAKMLGTSTCAVSETERGIRAGLRPNTLRRWGQVRTLLAGPR